MTATAETIPAPATELVAYHWVITLQGYADDGIAAVTVDGTASLCPGTSRQSVFQGVQREAQRMIRERAGNTFTEDPTCVLFFSLERDEL